MIRRVLYTQIKVIQNLP